MTKMKIRILFILPIILLVNSDLNAQIIKKEIPVRLVVLTFDDAVSSHAEFVAPLLEEYGFEVRRIIITLFIGHQKQMPDEVLKRFLMAKQVI